MSKRKDSANQIAWVGPAGESGVTTSDFEFAPIYQGLRNRREISQTFATLPDALRRWRSIPADVSAVVLATERPGVFRSADVEAARALLPLAQFVVVLGSWCEGEERTGQPWEGVWRIYWHQWLPGTGLPEWLQKQTLPASASAAERCTAEVASIKHAEMSCSAEIPVIPVIVVFAERYADFQSVAVLADLCGVRFVWFADANPAKQENCVGAIWIGNDAGGSEKQILDFQQSLAVCSQPTQEPTNEPTPLLVVTQYPRRQCWLTAQNVPGFCGLLSQPIALPSFVSAIQRMLQISGT